MDIIKYGLGGDIEKDLEKSNIILNRQLIPGDIKAGRHYMNPGGLRIGVSEVTRLGMNESDILELADFICRVIIKKEKPDKVAKDVSEFKKSFKNVQYCFESSEAYQYINIR